MSALQELKETTGTILARRTELKGLFEKKTADGKLDWSAEHRDRFTAIEKELGDLETKASGLRSLASAEKKNRMELKRLNTVRVPGSFSGARATEQGLTDEHRARPETKGVGDLFVASKSYQARVQSKRRGGQDWGFSLPAFESKTLFQTSAGYDPFVARRPGIVLSAQQQPKVVDLIPTSETQFHSIKWMLETTYTNAADATAEGGLYPEAALQYTEQLSPVQKLSVFLPVTDEQLDDVPRMRDVLNTRLELMLRQKFDQELLGGTGTSPHLKGLLNVTGIQTQAKGTDATPSAIYKAMTAIRFTAFADPTAVIMNPADWQNILLLQTADGLYIYGHPANDTVSRIWGLPVVQTNYCTAGTAVVADFQQHTEIVWRKGIEFLVSNSHSDFFARGQQAVRADMRAAFVVTRPAAVCTVTGL